MFSDFKQFRTSWKSAWSNPAFRNQFAITVMLFVGVMFSNFYYLRIWQTRPGIQLNDFILNLLPPHDFSPYIFFIQYTSLLIVFLFVLPNPHRLTKGLQMFAVVFLARTLTIYLIPLEPPRDMILLNDPVATFVFHTDSVYVTKDLFFSGHVSACVLLWLIVDKKFLKVLLSFTTVIVGLLIMWQHVHYSTDVIFAPLFALVSYWAVQYMHAQSKYGLQTEPETAVAKSE